MKYVRYLTILFILFSEPGEAQWFWQNPTPQGNNLNSIFFINSEEGWAGGWNGTIIHTNDGGDNWEIQYNHYPYIVNSVFFIDELKGWAAGGPPDWSGIVYRTTDGGISWDVTDPNYCGDHMLQDVFFMNDQVGWVVGWRNEAFKTSNGGITWGDYSFGTGDDYNSVFFQDLQNGWIVGDQGIVYRTTNGGNNWTADTVSASSLQCIVFINDSTGYICGTDGTIMMTTDGGDSWIQKNSALAGILREIQFISADTGFIVGAGIQRTVDGGNSWQVMSLQTCFSGSFSGSTGYTAGIYGIMSKSYDYGTTWNNLGSFAGFVAIKTSFFLDENNGWLIEAEGGYRTWHTSDGGDTWACLDTQNTYYVKKILFTDTLNGWASCENHIIHTNDEGYSWYPQYTASGYYYEFGDIFFTDSDHGWAGRVDTLFSTIDGGITWQVSVISPGVNLGAIFFLNQDTGWISGAQGNIFFTYDGGLTWSQYSCSTTFGSMVFTDPMNGWGVSNDGIFHSSDGGHSWILQNNEISFTHISFSDPMNGWACGGRSRILHTDNGGLTWEPQEHLSDDWTRNIQFVDQNTGWYTGSRCTILKTLNGGVVGVKPDPIIRNHSLLGIYPNPAESFTTIHYKIHQCSLIRLGIIDLLGREKMVLVNASQPAGEYTLNSDVSSLPPGVYFCTIRINDDVDVKKIIITGN